MLLVAAAFRQENGVSVGSSRHEPLIAMIISNRNAVACLPGGSAQIERNVLPDTFEWTNRSGSSSTVGFMPFKKTND
jgi:hypothetical protein